MNRNQKLVCLYFLLLPFIDLITSLVTRLTDIPVSLGMIVKGLTLLFLVSYTFFFSKSKYKTKSCMYLITLFIFMIIYLLTKPDIFNIDNFSKEIIYSLKYMYFPIILIGSLNLFEDYNINNKILKKILVINCISYSALLLIPYITGTSFNSYNYDSVFGKNGWFYSANETGAIMIILLSSLSYFLTGKNKFKILLAFPILMSVSIIGTKVSFLGMVLVVILVVLFNIFKLKKLNKIDKRNSQISSAILILILLVVLSFSPAYTNLKNSLDRVENTEEENNDEYIDMDDITSNKNIAKIITVALNGREKLFLSNLTIYIKAPVTDKLLGLGWNDREDIDYHYYKKLIEIDYLDIFIHYGIIGFIIYFLPLLILIFKSIFKSRYIGYDGVFYLLILLLSLGISSFAGHVLASPPVSIYLVVLSNILINKLNKEKDIKEKDITILALHLGYGGIEKYISSLSNMLKDNFNITIISTYKVLDKPAFKFDNKINIVYLIDDKPNKEEFKFAIKNKNIINILKEGYKSVKILYLKKHRNIKAISKIDSKYIITTREFHSKLVGVYASKNIIKIATEHNPLNINDKKYINDLIKSLYNFNYFVVVSPTIRDYYKDKIGKTKCIYIPNVIDNIPQNKSQLKENNLISIGRMETEKGQLDLIDIILEIKKTIPNIKLYLIGDGSLRNTIENKIKENKLEENIILTGFINKNELEKYFLKSKLYVMTSVNESFGLVLIESMSYGVPCIAFDSADGAKNILKDDVGVLIPNRNIKEMAEQIIELLNNNKEINNLSNKSLNKCKEFLSDNVKKEWLDLLK